MYSSILWDFNGTILDDVGIGIESINALLAPRRLPTLDSREAYQARFRFPIIEYYADLGFNTAEYDQLAVEWVEQYLARVPSAPLQPGIKDVLEALSARGIEQIILSATEQSQLQRQVEVLGIAHHFTHILGLDNIHASSKIQRALEWKHASPRGKMLMIGDTDHDAATARALGADCILLSIGHQSKETLLTCGVTVLDSPHALLPLILSENEV